MGEIILIEVVTRATVSPFHDLYVTLPYVEHCDGPSALVILV